MAAARCAETPDAAPSATVHWNIPVTGGDPTITAGQAVEFITTGPSPTVTEGTNGKAAANACIDKVIGSDAAAMSVVVTFYQPGDYSITCRKIPEEMHTVVHVR
jgi:plastocyanin